MFQWKESKKDPRKLKSHSADDDDAHGAQRSEKSSLANEISDRRVTQIDEGRDSANCHSPGKSICVQLGRCRARKLNSRRKRTGRVRHRVSRLRRRLIRIRGNQSQKTTRNQVQVVFFVDRISSGSLLCCWLDDAGARRMCVRKTRRRG